MRPAFPGQWTSMGLLPVAVQHHLLSLPGRSADLLPIFSSIKVVQPKTQTWEGKTELGFIWFKASQEPAIRKNPEEGSIQLNVDLSQNLEPKTTANYKVLFCLAWIEYLAFSYLMQEEVV